MVEAYTFWTDSGGGGKTTMCLNVAHALANKGNRVLCWDVDQQRGSLTDAVGLTEYLVDKEINALDAVFDDDKSLADVILSSGKHDIPFDLIPGTLQWEQFDKVLSRSAVPNEWMVFRQAILDAGLHEQYDVILLDCEGRRGLKERNAIVATQNVVIPTAPTRKGRNDVGSARDYIHNRIQKPLADSGTNLKFELKAVVPNKVKQNKSSHSQSLQLLRDDADLPVTDFVFYDRGPYDDALERQESLFDFAESSETRDLYDYEPEILEKYNKLAELITNG